MNDILHAMPIFHRDPTFVEALQKALEKLKSGVLEEAHQLLVKLIRTHYTDPELVFALGLARKKLGYTVSAEALLSQALDLEHALPEEELSEVEDHPGLFRWTDSSGEVVIHVKKHPRRRSLRFVGFGEVPEESSDASE